MSETTYRSTPSTKTQESFSYNQRRRAERIYALDGLTPVDTAVLLALNFHSKPDGSEMHPSTATLAVMKLSNRFVYYHS